MRARGPIYAGVSNHFVVTGYDEVVAAMKEERFLVEPLYEYPLIPGLTRESIVKSNPPRHTELRRLIGTWFSPRTIKALEDVVATQCDELLDPVMAKGEFDLVQEFALPLAIRVIASILGVPASYYDRFQELGDAASRMLDPYLTPEQNAVGRAASDEIVEYFTVLYDERRSEPGNDLLSTLLFPSDGETEVTEAELLANAQFVLLAGYETTVGMIGSGVHMLLDRPDCWDAMRADDDALVANVIEETLRLESPVQILSRRPAEDVEFLGFHIPADARVIPIIAAANRDPAMFPDPGRFDPRRDNANRHLAFVVGPHHCLGSSLARLEGQVAFRSLLKRMPEIRRAGPAVRRPNLVARGITNLPVAFSPSA